MCNLCYIFYWVVYLNFPKWFQQCSNTEKSVILVKVKCFLWSPFSGVIFPSTPVVAITSREKHETPDDTSNHQIKDIREYLSLSELDSDHSKAKDLASFSTWFLSCGRECQCVSREIMWPNLAFQNNLTFTEKVNEYQSKQDFYLTLNRVQARPSQQTPCYNLLLSGSHALLSCERCE